MSFDGAKLIWHNGQMIPWEQATVHVMAHALHYGSSVFEGIRVYKTPDGPKVFRLTAHMQRFFDSALIHRISVPFDLPTLIAGCKEVVSANELLDGAYIRPIAFRALGTLDSARNLNTLSMYRSPPGNGAPISVRTVLKKAWMSVSLAGTGSRPTPYRRWPRLVAITFRVR